MASTTIIDPPGPGNTFSIKRSRNKTVIDPPGPGNTFSINRNIGNVSLDIRPTKKKPAKKIKFIVQKVPVKITVIKKVRRPDPRTGRIVLVSVPTIQTVIKSKRIPVDGITGRDLIYGQPALPPAIPNPYAGGYSPSSPTSPVMTPPVPDNPTPEPDLSSMMDTGGSSGGGMGGILDQAAAKIGIGKNTFIVASGIALMLAVTMIKHKKIL